MSPMGKLGHIDAFTAAISVNVTQYSAETSHYDAR